MPETKIRVPPETKDRLDILIIKLKKHRKGRVTHADAIEHLFKKVRTQNATIRTHEQTIESLKKDHDKPEPEKTQDTEISTATPTQNQEINEEPTPPQTPLMDHPPCPFHLQGENPDTVLCTKDYDKKRRYHKVPLIVCNQCWQRNKDIFAPQEIHTNDFPCYILCKQFPKCTSRALRSLDEIIADNCYVGKYPFEWVTPEGKTVRVCKFMRFKNDNPHDPEHPYPQCIAKQKDVPFQLPKDRIIKDPQNCWTCYNLRKKEREQKLYKKTVDPFKGHKHVDWHDGNPMSWDI